MVVLLSRKRLEERCGFVREVSAAASVGAFALQRCPPDIRTPLYNSLTLEEKFCVAIHSVVERYKEIAE